MIAGSKSFLASRIWVYTNVLTFYLYLFIYLYYSFVRIVIQMKDG